MRAAGAKSEDYKTWIARMESELRRKPEEAVTTVFERLRGAKGATVFDVLKRRNNEP